jgi:hypothetical protein
MATRSRPAGWPARVPPPTGGPSADQWQRSAVRWLLDNCPPEYRGLALLQRQPEVLARLTAWHVQAQQAATRQGLARARAEFSGLGAQVVDDTLLLLERELVRLQVLAREVAAIEHAFGPGARTA